MSYPILTTNTDIRVQKMALGLTPEEFETRFRKYLKFKQITAKKIVAWESSTTPGDWLVRFGSKATVSAACRGVVKFYAEEAGRSTTGESRQYIEVEAAGVGSVFMAKTHWPYNRPENMADPLAEDETAAEPATELSAKPTASIEEAPGLSTPSRSSQPDHARESSSPTSGPFTIPNIDNLTIAEETSTDIPHNSKTSASSYPEHDVEDGEEGSQPVEGETIHPAQQTGTAPIPDRIELKPLKWDPLLPRTDRFTSMIQPDLKGDENVVIANYVEITSWPSTVYEYNIDFGKVEKGLKKMQQKTYRKISQMRTKRSILDTLRPVEPLVSRQWATDYKNIFSLTPLWPHAHPNEIYSIGPVLYRRPDGRVSENGPVVKLTFARELNMPDPAGPFRLPVGYPHRERIVEAFNAFVSEHAKATAQGRNVALAAPNKFFDLTARVELGDHGDDMLAYRGFSLSTRPTANRLLLSIAPLTSAFYRPCTVQQWIERLVVSGWTREHAMASLVGVRCRLVHDRPRHGPSTDPNPNLEANRYKIITEFGKSLLGNAPLAQEFIPNGWDGTTLPLPLVRSHFAHLLAVSSQDFQNTICVNVGLKLKFQPTKQYPRETSTIQRTQNWDQYEFFAKAVWIPSNLLEIEPHQIYNKLLQGAHTNKMVTVACQAPALNRAWIEQRGFEFLGIGRLQSLTLAQNWIQRLQLDFANPQLLRVPVKTVPIPRLQFGGIGASVSRVPVHAEWDLRNTSFAHRSTVHSFRYVRIRFAPTDPSTSTLFNTRLTRACATHGIAITNRSATADRFMNIANPHNETQVMRDVWNWFDRNKATLVANAVFIIILPNDNVGTFSAIKMAADFHGVHTVCVLSAKVDGPVRDNQGNIKQDRSGQDMMQPSMQYCSNLCLKISAKLATDVHHINTFGAHRKLDETIVLGADIGSGKGGPPGTPSIACVVGTVDREFMNMPGSMRPVAAKSMIIPVDPMKEMVKERLNAYADKHAGNLPTKILYYRDGVSQSQYAALLANAAPAQAIVPGSELASPPAKGHGKGKGKGKGKGPATEVPVNTEKPAPTPKAEKPNKHTASQATSEADGEIRAIELAYSECLDRGKKSTVTKLAITLVVVGKRHNTRFFPNSPSQWIDQYTGNLKPGYLVDSDVTLENDGDILHNFFLQSHKALQGTARTGHYVVLRNEMDLGNDELHAITQAFCYAYTRATKGVSYCAPAYHADKLCTRGEEYMRHIARRLEGSPWWKAAKPDRKADFTTWYERIANNVAASAVWKGNGAHGRAALVGRGNPWHPDLDAGMFYI